jgi:hypothetical protein
MGDIMSAPITASAHTHVGTLPPGYNQEWVTHTVHCHGFESFSAEEDESLTRPNLCSWGINGFWWYVRLEMNTQTKEWCPSTSKIDQTNPSKLIMVSASMMTMESKWRSNDQTFHVILILRGTLMGVIIGDLQILEHVQHY